MKLQTPIGGMAADMAFATGLALSTATNAVVALGDTSNNLHLVVTVITLRRAISSIPSPRRRSPRSQ